MAPVLAAALLVSISAPGFAQGVNPSPAEPAPADPPVTAAPMQLKLSTSIADSIANGRLLLELRPRYARITETVRAKTTDAWVLRSTVGWQTAPFHDVRLTAQYINTRVLGPANFNADPRAFASPYPLLPDPAHSGINQLFADYSGLTATRVRVGRQIVRIDDQRFISDVDFRQTPQVFDGVSVITNAIPETEIQLGEYRRMRTVLGATNNLRLQIVHAAWNPLPDHTLAAFSYWHDQAATGAQTGFANNAQRITGVHAEGSVALGDGWRGMYFLEYAKQNRIGDGDPRIKADYKRIGGGVASSYGGLRIDHEIKGSGNGSYGFQTPLTDYYAFNGWALQFTTTPPQGLRDSWLTARTHWNKLEIYLEAHRFRSDFGGLALGREVDIGLTYPLLQNLFVKLQHAQFRAGDGARVKNDVDKTWLALSYIY